MKYIVERPELHISYVAVEAESKDEAIHKVRNGEGNVEDSVYKYSLNETDTGGFEWNAEPFDE